MLSATPVSRWVIDSTEVSWGPVNLNVGRERSITWDGGRRSLVRTGLGARSKAVSMVRET
jgi:hypothetical protein